MRRKETKPKYNSFNEYIADFRKDHIQIATYLPKKKHEVLMHYLQQHDLQIVEWVELMVDLSIELELISKEKHYGKYRHDSLEHKEYKEELKRGKIGHDITDEGNGRQHNDLSETSDKSDDRE